MAPTSPVNKKGLCRYKRNQGDFFPWHGIVGSAEIPKTEQDLACAGFCWFCGDGDVKG